MYCHIRQYSFPNVSVLPGVIAQVKSNHEQFTQINPDLPIHCFYQLCFSAIKLTYINICFKLNVKKTGHLKSPIYPINTCIFLLKNSSV